MKIICIGRNYANHIEELQNERPDSPVVFIKPDTTIGQKTNPFTDPIFPTMYTMKSKWWSKSTVSESIFSPNLPISITKK